MATLTSQVVTVKDGRESGIAALEHLLSYGAWVLSHEYLFGDATAGGPDNPLPAAPSLSPDGLLAMLADFTNRGYASIPDYLNWVGRLRVGDSELSDVYPDLKPFLYGPVDILLIELEGRALSQANARVWTDRRRRVRNPGLAESGQRR